MEKLRSLWFVVPALALAGCDVSNLWQDEAKRVTEAFPVSQNVMNAKVELDRLQPPDSEFGRRLAREYANRLEARALGCLQGAELSTFDSASDLRGKLSQACFNDADVQLVAWLGTYRLRLIAQLPAIGTSPAQAPKSVSTSIPPITVSFAAAAPWMAVSDGMKVEIVDIAGDRSVYRSESTERRVRALEMSPNGRVFVVAGQGISLHDSATGDLLAEYPNHSMAQWLTSLGVLLNKKESGEFELLDLSNGTLAPARGISDLRGRAVAVAGVPNAFILANRDRVVQFELVPEAQGIRIVLLNQRNTSDLNSLQNLVASADGKVLAGSAGRSSLVRVDPSSLSVAETKFDGFQVHEVCALDDPNELLLRGYVPGAMRRARGELVYFLDSGSLAPISDDAVVKQIQQTGSCPVRSTSLGRTYVRTGNSLSLLGNPPRVERYSPAAIGAYFGELVAQERESLPPGYAASDPYAGETGARGAIRAVLSDLPKDAQVHAVGVYEAEGAPQRGFREPGVPSPVEVIVRKSSTPVVLVVSSYEPVIWRITIMPGAKVSAILLSGNSPLSKVMGTGDARVVTLGRHYAYDMGSQQHRALDQEVMRWTGKRIQSLQGRYKGRVFTVQAL